MDVVNALHNGWKYAMPEVIGGRYGLASKEFNAGMVKAVFDELKKEKPKNNFTIGIDDDVTHTSLNWDKKFFIGETTSVPRVVLWSWCRWNGECQ